MNDVRIYEFPFDCTKNEYYNWQSCANCEKNHCLIIRKGITITQAQLYKVICPDCGCSFCGD